MAWYLVKAQGQLYPYFTFAFDKYVSSILKSQGVILQLWGWVGTSMLRRCYLGLPTCTESLARKWKMYVSFEILIVEFSTCRVH
jgi:hypothetical protein